MRSRRQKRRATANPNSKPKQKRKASNRGKTKQSRGGSPVAITEYSQEADSESEEEIMDDEMQNSWGVQYFLSAGTNDRIHYSKHDFDAIISTSVPNFRLMDLAVSGTAANTLALNVATDSDHSKALFAVGSYVGGDPLLQKYSSSGYSPSNKLALPSLYADANSHCQAQNIPFPYWV